jgi:hypothetical protein
MHRTSGTSLVLAFLGLALWGVNLERAREGLGEARSAQMRELTAASQLDVYRGAMPWGEVERILEVV